MYSFKGLAIGLQSSKENVLAIFAAVMMHKAIMAFSLGLNIAQSSFSVKILTDSQNKFKISKILGESFHCVQHGVQPGKSPWCGCW